MDEVGKMSLEIRMLLFAAGVSYLKWSSVGWALVHGGFGGFYLIYAFMQWVRELS